MSPDPPPDSSHGRALPFITITQDAFRRGRPRQDPHVRRHVMLDHRRRERQAATERYQREQRETQARAAAEAAAAAAAAAAETSNSSVQSTSGSSDGWTTESGTCGSPTGSDESLELVQQPLTAGRLDPFNAFAAIVTADVHNALEYFAKVMVPATRPSDLQVGNPRTHGIIQFVLAAEHCIDSFVAAMTIGQAMNVYANESRSLTVPQPDRHQAFASSTSSSSSDSRLSLAQPLMAKGLAYMTRAIRRMNEQTAAHTLASNPQNVATLLELLVCDILLGETTRGEIHCLGLRTLVNHRGGLAYLPGPFADAVVISDMHMATMCHRTPMHPLIDGMEESLRSNLAQACTAHGVLTWRHEPLILHPDLIQHLTLDLYTTLFRLQDIVNYTNTFQRAQHAPFLLPPIRQLYISKTLAVEHAILSQIPRRQHPQQAESQGQPHRHHRRHHHRRTSYSSPHQTFTILSSLLMIYTAIQKWSPFSPLVRILVRQLLLSPINLSSHPRRTALMSADPNFYLWTLFLAAHASSGQTTRPVILKMVREAGEVLGLGSNGEMGGWEEVKTVLSVVGLYIKGVLEKGFQEIWNEVILTSDGLRGGLGYAGFGEKSGSTTVAIGEMDEFGEVT